MNNEKPSINQNYPEYSYKLTPFKLFTLQNFPYIEADFDAITNYQLFCKVVEYLNEVIANENTVESIVQQQIDNINTLYNWFLELDVQDEINNKLDEMTENGTLSSIISGYINPYLEQFNTRLSQQDAKIEAVESGSPIAVASVSEMTDTTRVYVNTTDGNWYYYNGSTWVSGGIYQATGISANSIGLKEIDLSLKNYHLFKTNWLKGSASLDRGMYEPSTNRIRTKRMIYLEAGTLIKFTQNTDTPLRWSYQTFASTDNTSGTFNAGWKTDALFVLPDTTYYCFMMSYNDNAEINDESIDSLSEYLNFYRPILNYAGRLINWYSGREPFEIEELYSYNDTNDNIKINSRGSYWIVFENMQEFYNRTSWNTTRKLTSAYIKYDLGTYGTVNTVTEGTTVTDNFDVILPNNYCLVLNVVSGIMSVKNVAEVSINDALLLRNSLGHAVHGAFKEIYDYWILYKLTNNITLLDTYIDFDKNVKGIAHRGYSEEAPENTIPAYTLARKKGFNYVETDVSFTSDGVAVLLHDNTIDRTSNGTGEIGSLTYNQVREYDFGSWKNQKYAGTKIPSFEEFISICKNLALHPYIELKNNATYTESQIQSLIDIVNNYGMKDKVTWISFSNTYLIYVKNYDSKARLGYVVSNIDSNVIEVASSLKTQDNNVFIDANINNITNETILLAITNKIPVEVWTANTESLINNMNNYITGVTSNYLIAGKVLYENNINKTI